MPMQEMVRARDMLLEKAPLIEILVPIVSNAFIHDRFSAYTEAETRSKIPKRGCISKPDQETES